MTEKILISLDGTSASGKGTLAKKLSEFFQIPYMDTGKLYRIFALKVMQKSLNPNNEFSESFIKSSIEEHCAKNDQILKNESVGNTASLLAKNQLHRKCFSQIFAEFIRNQKKGVVLDGRDTAYLLPKNGIKIYVDARANARAKRRFKELCNKKTRVMYKNILRSIVTRDIRDTHRKQSPLKVDKNAIYVDSTGINIETAFAYTLRKINSYILQSNK